MKQVINIITIFLILNSNLFGVFGVGDIVSDPNSYTYYMKQIKAMNDQMEGIFKQIEQLNKINELTEEANKLISNTGEKIYDPRRRIKGIINNLNSSKNRMRSIARRVKNTGSERFFKEYHSVNEPVKEEDFEKWKEDFEKIFSNKNDKTYKHLKKKIEIAVKNGSYEDYGVATKNMNTYLNLKNIEKSNLNRYALLAPTQLYNEYYISEKGVKRRAQQEQTIEKLIKQIGEEKDLLKQTKTTNQILIEMITILKEQYQLQLQYYNAMSVLSLANLPADSEISNLEIERVKKELRNSKKKVITAKQKQEAKEAMKRINDMIKEGGESLERRRKNRGLTNLDSFY